MIIDISKVSAKLETFARLYHKEFSGFGFVERTKEAIVVNDIVLLDVGSETFTEIGTDKLLALMNRPDADKMKLWFHRHPCDGWSGMDVNTILHEPFGGIPELVKWSASIVLTPHGWIGRMDSYKTKQTLVCEVVPNEYAWASATLNKILDEKEAAYKLKYPSLIDGRIYQRDAQGRFSTTKYLQGGFDPAELDPDWEDDLEDAEELFEDELTSEEEVEDELSPYEKQALAKNNTLFDWVKRLVK